MKTIALTLFAAAFGLAQTQHATSVNGEPAEKSAATSTPVTQAKKPAAPPKSSPTAAQAARAQSQTQSIPAGATQVEPNMYRYTDSNGKTWMYRQTPFGISRWEEGAVPAPQPTAKSDPVSVTDLGDSVRFDKKTPFGGSSWVRKKTELNDEEKALVDAQRQPAETNKATGEK
jgi:hypothetical protein